MTYEWTAEQIASLAPGCTVEAFGERREVGRATVAHWSGRMIVETKLPSKEFWLSDCDPSTIEPPTVDTLTRMAVEAFGEGAEVREKAVFAHATRYEVHDANEVRASFMNTDSARECARYLAGRRK